MKTDDLALLCFAGATVLIGVATLLAAWYFTSPRKAKKSKPAALVAQTAVFRPWRQADGETALLHHPVAAETVMLREVDPTALPKPRRSRIYSAGRRLR